MAGVGSHAARIGLVRFAGEVPYAPALALQDAIASSVKKGSLPSLLISLQHKPCFTLGKRGKLDDVLARDEEAKCDGVEVVRSNRGGEVTYHGPGQVVVYPIVNLRTIKFGPRKYVETLEDAVVHTVAEMGLSARGRVPGATGVWIGDRKVAAIGVRISGGVATHGVALNVDPDLSKFRDIVPCGITDREVTSVWRELGGRGPTAEEIGDRLLRRLAALLGSPGGGFSPLSPPEMGEVEGFARRVAPGASFSVEAPHPSNIAGLLDSQDDAEEGGRDGGRHQPADIRQGLRQASIRLSSGMIAAAELIQVGGGPGASASPTDRAQDTLGRLRAVAGATAGATAGAIKCTLLGARNGLDPERFQNQRREL